MVMAANGSVRVGSWLLCSQLILFHVSEEAYHYWGVHLDSFFFLVNVHLDSYSPNIEAIFRPKKTSVNGLCFFGQVSEIFLHVFGILAQVLQPQSQTSSVWSAFRLSKRIRLNDQK